MIKRGRQLRSRAESFGGRFRSSAYGAPLGGLLGGTLIVPGGGGLEALRSALRALDLDEEALEVVALEAVALDLLALAVDLAGVSFGAAARPLTTSLKPCPARNRGTLVAFIFTGSPLRGLRAVRALRSCRSKVPKPTSATRSPFFTAT
jgi:hypothetical protein